MDGRPAPTMTAACDAATTAALVLLRPQLLFCYGSLDLERLVSADGDSVHDPGFRGVVVHREMLGGTVVPAGERSGRPAHAAGVFRTDRLFHEKIDQRLAFLVSQAVEVLNMATDIDRFP